MLNNTITILDHKFHPDDPQEHDDPISVQVNVFREDLTKHTFFVDLDVDRPNLLFEALKNTLKVEYTIEEGMSAEDCECCGFFFDTTYLLYINNSLDSKYEVDGHFGGISEHPDNKYWDGNIESLHQYAWAKHDYHLILDECSAYL